MGILQEFFPNFSGEKKQKTANDDGILDKQKPENKKKPADNDEEAMSRRDFLKKAAAATATAAVSYSAAIKGAKELHGLLGNDGEKIGLSSKNDISDHDAERDDIFLDPETDSDAAEENIEKKKNVERKIENICDHFKNAYEFLSSYENKDGKKEFWEDDVFPDKFFIAVQLTESNFEADAVSNKNAYGVMQIREIAIKDVIKFLNKLKRTGVYDKYDGPDFRQLEMDKWKHKVETLKESLKTKKDKIKSTRVNELREKIKEQEEKNKPILEEIVKIIKKDPNYNRAIGKSYFMQLFNKNYGYGIGWDECQKGGIKEAQKKLAMAYNCGPTHFKKNYPNGYFDEETKNYPIKVFNFEKRYDNIKIAFEKNGIKANNEAIMLMARRMNAAGNRELRYKMLDTYIKKLKEDNNLVNLNEDWPKKKSQYKLLIAKNFDIFDKKR